MEIDLRFLVGIAFFVAIILIIKIVTDNHIRNKLIDKGMVDENLKYLYPQKSLMHPFLPSNELLQWVLLVCHYYSNNFFLPILTHKALSD